jgi:hypothetical protein
MQIEEEFGPRGERQQQQEKPKVKPVATARSGRVQCAVWKNKSGKGFNVTFKKNYKDENGEWQETSSFQPWDLPHLQALCQKVWSKLEDKV